MTRMVRRRSFMFLVALALAAPFAPPLPAAEPKPRIGLIGSGNVGSNLGRVWARAGYPVMFSSRDLEADRRLATEVGASARAGTPAEAAAFGEVLVLAVPYGAQPELGRTLGAAFRNKIVIDAATRFPRATAPSPMKLVPTGLARCRRGCCRARASCGRSMRWAPREWALCTNLPARLRCPMRATIARRSSARNA